MTIRRILSTTPVITAVVLGLGCSQTSYEHVRAPNFSAPNCNGCRQPQAAVPTYQPYQPQPFTSAPPAQPFTPVPQAPSISQYPTRPQYNNTWQPAPGATPNYPRTSPKISEKRSDELPKPKPSDGGIKLLPPDTSKEVELKPPVTEERQPPPVRPDKITKPDAADAPTDIPNFHPINDRVATGLQPFLDGYEWLRNHHYRGVLHIRAPGEDDAAVRSNAEAKGLLYKSIEVSPQKLNRELVQEFGKLVGDAGNQPLFVFDRKGMLAGSLWYLHFRLTDKLPDAEARKKAMELGLKEETSGGDAELWAAINQLVR